MTSSPTWTTPPLCRNKDRAEAWANAGMHVFPCCPKTKKPLIRGWRNELPEMDGYVAAHWSRFPTAMPALDCKDAGVVVIDCDRTRDVDGETNFRTLCGSLEIDLAQVPRVRTPRGGMHFYFARPEEGGVKNSVGKIAQGVDVRGDGGCVIAPGSSRNDGVEYTVIHPQTLGEMIACVGNRTLPILPTALSDYIHRTNTTEVIPFDLRAVRPPGHGQSCGAQSKSALGTPVNWRLEQAAHSVELAPEGTRNDTLNRAAFTAGLMIARGALDDQEALDRLIHVGASRDLKMMKSSPQSALPFCGDGGRDAGQR